MKQKLELLESGMGCGVLPNMYKVYPADSYGRKIGHDTIFKYKERKGVVRSISALLTANRSTGNEHWILHQPKCRKLSIDIVQGEF